MNFPLVAGSVTSINNKLVSCHKVLDLELYTSEVIYDITINLSLEARSSTPLDLNFTLARSVTSI